MERRNRQLRRRFDMTCECEQRLALLGVQLTEPRDGLGELVIRCVEAGGRNAKLVCQPMHERNVWLAAPALVARHACAGSTLVQSRFNAQLVLGQPCRRSLASLKRAPKTERGDGLGGSSCRITASGVDRRDHRPGEFTGQPTLMAPCGAELLRSLPMEQRSRFFLYGRQESQGNPSIKCLPNGWICSPA